MAAYSSCLLAPSTGTRSTDATPTTAEFTAGSVALNQIRTGNKDGVRPLFLDAIPGPYPEHPVGCAAGEDREMRSSYLSDGDLPPPLVPLGQNLATEAAGHSARRRASTSKSPPTIASQLTPNMCSR